MNHKKFIQLLNLYIDGEATEAEIRAVEDEIAANPARRRIHRDYCRMQAATRALYAGFRAAPGAAAPGEPGIRTLDAQIVGAFPGRRPGRPFRRALLWSGGALAACLAVALTFLSLPRSGGSADPLMAAGPEGVSVPALEHPAVAASGETFAAPFALETRADPYLVRSGAPATDPFSLAPLQRRPAFDERDLVLAPVRQVATEAPLPASLQLDPERIAEQNRKLKAILRGQPEGETRPAQTTQPSGQYLPVNMRQ